MGCQHSVPQVVGPRKISPASAYGPSRQAASEFKFKRSRSGSIDTDVSSRLESRDSGRIKPGLAAPGGSGDHVFLNSLDELDNQCAKFTRNKPIVITAALKKKLISDHEKSQGSKEVILPGAPSDGEQKTTLNAAFVPHRLSVVEDLSSSGDFSIDLVKMLDLIEVRGAPQTAGDGMPEIDPDYVHVDPDAIVSCFAVQPDSWYKAPRPFLRIQVVDFRWK